jgi:hypothetical protein
MIGARASVKEVGSVQQLALHFSYTCQTGVLDLVRQQWAVLFQRLISN